MMFLVPLFMSAILLGLTISLAEHGNVLAAGVVGIAAVVLAWVSGLVSESELP